VRLIVHTKAHTNHVNENGACAYSYRSPASSTLYTVVTDPATATVLSSEQSYSPLFQDAGPHPLCLPGTTNAAKGPGASGLDVTELQPDWTVTIATGVVDSDTALPQ
jgi:hypothetical protein